jgi:hypothetical protein
VCRAVCTPLSRILSALRISVALYMLKMKCINCVKRKLV